MARNPHSSRLRHQQIRCRASYLCLFVGNAVTLNRLISKGCYRYRVTRGKYEHSPYSFGQGLAGCMYHGGEPKALGGNWRYPLPARPKSRRTYGAYRAFGAQETYDCLLWWWREDRHDDQTRRTRIPNRVLNTRRCERRIASSEEGTIFTDGDQAAAGENEIELVLAAVNVRSVFLARFKRVESDEERLSFGHRALAHLVRGKLCGADYAFGKHDPQFTRPPQPRIGV